jgi:flagellar biogenesis protein FliO
LPFSTGRPNKAAIESRGKLALSAQHALHLIRIGDRDLVLGVYPSGITLLCDLTPSALSHIATRGDQP